jgi:mannosyltransferase
MASTGGLWRDEALFVFVLRIPSWRGMFEWIALSESHPPLYYVLARLWSIPFGTGELAMVALPIVCGVATVPVAVAFTAAISNTRAAAAAGYLVALSPPLVEYSALARPYALLPLLCLLSVGALCRALRTGSRKAWVGYVTVTVALLLTHNWALVVVLAEAFLAVIVLLSLRREFNRRAWHQLVAAELVVGVAYLPWLPFLLIQRRQAGHSPLDTTSPLWILGSFREAPGEFTFLLIWVVVIARWWTVEVRKRPSHALSGGKWAVPILIGVTVMSYITVLVLAPWVNLLFWRCVVMVVPPTLIALALWLDDWAGARTIMLAVAVMLMPQATMLMPSAVAQPRSNARYVAQFIDRHAMENDVVLVQPQHLASSLNYYLEGDREQIAYPEFGRSGLVSYNNRTERLQDEKILALTDSALIAARRTGRRIWVVRLQETWLRDTTDVKRLADLGRWGELEYVRLQHFRSLLDSLYGAPAFSSARTVTPGRYETLVAELFVP